MVDALCRAHTMLKPDGCIVDLHPSAALAVVEVAGQRTGFVQTDDGPLRHAAAGVALGVVLNEGLFTIDRSIEFAYYTYADTIEALRDYVLAKWTGSWIAEETVERTREAVRRSPGVRPRVRERVLVTRLLPRVGLLGL